MTSIYALESASPSLPWSEGAYPAPHVDQPVQNTPLAALSPPHFLWAEPVQCSHRVQNCVAWRWTRWTRRRATLGSQMWGHGCRWTPGERWPVWQQWRKPGRMWRRWCGTSERCWVFRTAACQWWHGPCSAGCDGWWSDGFCGGGDAAAQCCGCCTSESCTSWRPHSTRKRPATEMFSLSLLIEVWSSLSSHLSGNNMKIIQVWWELLLVHNTHQEVPVDPVDTHQRCGKYDKQYWKEKPTDLNHSKQNKQTKLVKVNNSSSIRLKLLVADWNYG